MKLSEAYKKYREEPDRYACCLTCKTAWLDDLAQHGTLFCPKCGQFRGAMYRGVADPKEMDCTLDKEDSINTKE